MPSSSSSSSSPLYLLLLLLLPPSPTTLPPWWKLSEASPSATVFTSTRLCPLLKVSLCCSTLWALSCPVFPLVTLLALTDSQVNRIALAAHIMCVVCVCLCILCRSICHAPVFVCSDCWNTKVCARYLWGNLLTTGFCGKSASSTPVCTSSESSRGCVTSSAMLFK